MDEASFWAHKGVRRGSGRGEHRQAFTGKGRVARGAGDSCCCLYVVRGWARLGFCFLRGSCFPMMTCPCGSASGGKSRGEGDKMAGRPPFCRCLWVRPP